MDYFSARIWPNSFKSRRTSKLRLSRRKRSGERPRKRAKVKVILEVRVNLRPVGEESLREGETDEAGVRVGQPGSNLGGKRT